MTEASGSGSVKKPGMTLLVSAIGVVYGDIGTSPLYALRECFAPERGLSTTPENVLGIVSLLIWTLTLVVCFKYLSVVLRADNRGEGGILALISLVSGSLKSRQGKAAALLGLMGIIGAALLYSDGILTPSVSVLSAVEGLMLITPAFQPFIVPAALVVLVLLFAFQYRGTEKVGRLFGPVMITWFVVIGVLGLIAIFQAPGIFAALNPLYALRFLSEHVRQSFGVLGSVFLAMTGAEVMYADMGHFGKRPIRRAWFFLIFPALILCYMGQAAVLLVTPDRVDNLFFQLVPTWGLYPLVILATLATVIASQAVISGAFSLARQSVQLGFLPRMRIQHTSADTFGQVYVPFINWALMLGTNVLVLVFQSSAKLTNAYGIAVSSDMLLTTCLMTFVALRIWRIKPWFVLPVVAVFAVIDVMFFLANASKLVSGGWIVVVFAAMLIIVMKTWRDGRNVIRRHMEAVSLSLEDFVASLALGQPQKVKGVAVFMAGNPKGIPLALLHNLKHNKVMHERTIVMSVLTVDRPWVPEVNRTTVTHYAPGFWQVIVHYGFSETPDIPALLGGLPELSIDPMQTTYFLGRESLVITAQRRGMGVWRKKLFWFLSLNAQAATSFFKLPPNRVVEIGAQTEL
jgi:KUP system potassium uptake protein